MHECRLWRVSARDSHRPFCRGTCSSNRTYIRSPSSCAPVSLSLIHMHGQARKDRIPAPDPEAYACSSCNADRGIRLQCLFTRDLHVPRMTSDQCLPADLRSLNPMSYYHAHHVFHHSLNPIPSSHRTHNPYLIDA